MDSKRFQISSDNVLYLRLLAALSGVCYLRNLPPVAAVSGMTKDNSNPNIKKPQEASRSTRRSEEIREASRSPAGLRAAPSSHDLRTL